MHWNWRLRSPNSGNANNVRNVNTDGSENNNNAYNGNVGVLPLRWIYRDRVARAAKAEAHHQRKAYPIQRKEDKHIAPTPGTTQLRGAGLPAVLHHYGQRLRKICEWGNLYDAYLKARRGKRWKNSVAKVEASALEAVALIQRELQTKTYRPGGYRAFYVYEPKRRLIQTNSFKDKIVQHAFCDQVLYDALTKPFILDNYGSQVGKGTHFGLNRLRDFMREYYRKNGFSADGWVLKADVRHYFQSIRPDVLKKDVAKYLHDPDCLTLAYQIIDSAPDPLGIPIGNQSSQIFALLYLNQLDHLCKEQLRFRYYGRYMDDFYIICESKERLQEALVVIRQHLAERGLELNKKTNIFPLRNGLDFLGFHTYIDDAGRVIRKVRKSSRDRMKRKLRKYAALYQRGEIDREKIAESYTSWRAHALHGDCRQLVAKYDQQFLSIFERRPEHVQEDQHSGRGC